MKPIHLASCTFVALFITFSCSNSRKASSQEKKTTASTTHSGFKADTLYKSENLILLQLSAHTYQHISFLNTNDFGRVACNGMLVVNDNQAAVFDTPTDRAGSEELVEYVTQELGSKIIAIIPTHFHEDCVGGMEVFRKHQVPAYASNRTIELLKKQGNTFTPYLVGFDNHRTFNLGDKKVYTEFLGEGHTQDNVIGYFPADRVLFGGCLVKELAASKGYLGDANVAAWPATALKVKRKYPQTAIVIPGHGKSGGIDLLDYTTALFAR